MNTWLMVATAGSLILAVIATMVAWRAVQDEKRRAAARVAALSAAAQARPVPIAPPPPVEQVTSLPLAGQRELESSSARANSGDVAMHTGFLGSEAPVLPSAGRQRGLVALAAVLAVLLGGLMLARIGGGRAQDSAASAQAAPLELLSLRHEREGGNLSLAGLVRNPAAAPVVERVSAVVFLFDQQGAFVTSARAPLDFLKLNAGDESPFVIKVEAPQSVARYRVSFRTEGGTVPHVDRRAEPSATPPVSLTRQE